MQKNILIVEDDPDQLANYTSALRRKGFECWPAACEADVWNSLPSRPDLALLDVHLGAEPDAGFALCQRLIERYPGLPVVFLSSRTDEIDQIFGLRLGGWDYLTKPISTVLLAEKVAAVLRQQEPSATQAVLQRSGWLIDGQRMRCSFDGVEANLTVTEFSIVQALVQADGAVLSFDQLAERTRQSVVTNNTLSTHIKHIRHKFRAIDPEFQALVSVYGRGYQWLD